MYTPSGGAELYELRIWNAAEDLCWKEEAGASHTGENAVYTLKVDGQDYLLRYVPFMGQGYCTYHYQLFSLDEKMQPVYYSEQLFVGDKVMLSGTKAFDE